MAKIWSVFWQFLMLGFVSFGGPAAHIGYFQRTFVEKLKWLDDNAYARLVSLSQFLPGPGSSQVGFALGLRQAGLAGGIAAFTGFTLPSFLALYLLAVAGMGYYDEPLVQGIIHGLKLLAVVVVADATLNMSRSFCKEPVTQVIMVLVAFALLVFPGLLTQMLVLILAAIAGMTLFRGEITQSGQKNGVSWLPLAIFALLFAATPMLAALSPLAKLFSDFYQAGSLVFGGGHVVLPLLQQSVGEMMSTDRFLVGYAAAQAVPGPMFTMATFLGADLFTDSPFTGALVATLAVFLPGFMLVLGLQKAWESLAERPKVAGAIWGINAAVVGLLLSALYSPVFVSAVKEPLDMALVIVGFLLLRQKLPIVALVAGFAVAGAALS